METPVLLPQYDADCAYQPKTTRQQLDDLVIALRDELETLERIQHLTESQPEVLDLYDALYRSMSMRGHDMRHRQMR